MTAAQKTPRAKDAFGFLLLLSILAIAGWNAVRGGRPIGAAPRLLIRRSLLTRGHDYKRFFAFPTVDFSSRFASGHLKHVAQTGPGGSAISVGADPGAAGGRAASRNWFYFRVVNKAGRQRLRLEVRNLRHNWAIWKNGMALAYRSSAATGNRWRMLRRRAELVLGRKALRLRVGYVLRRGETAEFALTYPYARGRLRRFLTRLQRRAAAQPGLYFARETLTLSSLGYPVEMLRLSSRAQLTRFAFPRLKNLFPLRGAAAAPDNRLFSRRKCNIVLSARVHPAETGASFMLEGLLAYLVANAGGGDVARLLERCAITAVPMLNPDGVELGFTRTDLAGRNLNAIYQQADINTPTIYALRKVVRYLDARSRIRLFLDFHTHATKRGFFLFGNPLRRASYRATLRFPFLLRRADPRFALRACGFGTDKFGYTSRREFGNKTQVPSVYTVESNYWGPAADLPRLRRARLIRGRVRAVRDYRGFYTRKDLRGFGEGVARAMVELVNGAPAALEHRLELRMDRYYAQKLKK